jgi:hypothetical protein
VRLTSPSHGVLLALDSRWAIPRWGGPSRSLAEVGRRGIFALPVIVIRDGEPVNVGDKLFPRIRALETGWAGEIGRSGLRFFWWFGSMVLAVVDRGSIRFQSTGCVDYSCGDAMCASREYRFLIRGFPMTGAPGEAIVTLIESKSLTQI